MTANDDYEFDIFLSYSRQQPVRDWVSNHFHPQLKQWLESTMRNEPKIFIDNDMETGVDWPDELCNNLKLSKCLVSVWSPHYFRSKWCMAEWESMYQRQVIIKENGSDNILVYPILFSDGDNFPENYKKVQWKCFKKWNYPEPVFRDTTMYIDFVKEIQLVCEELDKIIKSAPPWNENWPVISPNINEENILKLPRL